MSDFTLFSKAVHQRFSYLAACGELYLSHLNGDQLWEAYLAAFPEGTNPIFRERTEHDCSCCRNFIKNIGGVVVILDGYIQSVWSDIEDLPEPYATVAQKLAELIELHPKPIQSLYRTTANLTKFGNEVTYEYVEAERTQLAWNHFFGTVPDRYVVSSTSNEVNEFSTTVQMFKRALGVGLDPETGLPQQGISVSAVTTVLNLIDDDNLYRGAEYRHLVSEFRELAIQLQGIASAEGREVFYWSAAKSKAARIRNTAIGTLLVDLSEGRQLEQAVKSFEDKVSGTNYKRPKALITQGMIDSAMKTIDELGIETALQRRHANLGDITINNVIWADRSAQKLMKGGLAGILSDAVQPQVQDIDKAEDISIEDFMSGVVPNAAGIELYLRNSLQGNLVSLTAPSDPEAKRIFKWPNAFGWSYNGNVTDSIKERVKAAGGNVNAKLRVSLAWFNGDDLDIHAVCPDGHVHFRQKMGILDVDMNAGSAKNSVDPVENLSWNNPLDGKYQIIVHQYCRRSTDRGGFTLEVENEGLVTQYSYTPAIGHDDRLLALEFTVSKGKITELKVAQGLTGRGLRQDVWGVKTEGFIPVETLLFSPNHWDDHAIGNKHWFFILKGCLNPEPCRGIYNEYLIGELDQHRKVLEVLGSKTMCPPADKQLSGLGFSSTVRSSVTVRVTGAKVRKLFNVQF